MSSTTVLSASENVRSPIRYDRYVSSPRSRPDSMRWLDRSRCIPIDRPMRPMVSSRSTKSGSAVSSSPNSSMTSSRCGSGGRSGCCARSSR
ncbi:hypothetical protein [Cellulomonas sp.]|uniref:hypothetical protein n=1 Tax=Cellulomonas sp. TaxID=40001 RepID=UPI003BA8FD14